MACTTQSLISLNSCAFPSKRIPKWPQKMKGYSKNFVVYASSSSAEDDCNEEACAPEKEVGSLSMQWVAGENTKVVGTFPPKKKGWTGYVEKDTAGQTNIYSVEPTIYVAESAISSGTAGTSSEGSENTAALTAGLALISIAAASSILIQLNKNQTIVETVPYAGPPLSYYINKFKPAQFVEASIPAETQDAPSIEASVPPEASSSSSTVEASMAPTGELQS
ncbi:Proline-rich family protein [Rhynchospora pubera]|uniref:Proline-rich family protein n=1 Tax=Rhynchospora pubera TaxID=906938 RepID=A0AAV8FFE7_9POAL|nr:Proline-rich family protein [Rhynchospora pubera]